MAELMSLVKQDGAAPHSDMEAAKGTKTMPRQEEMSVDFNFFSQLPTPVQPALRTSAMVLGIFDGHEAGVVAVEVCASSMGNSGTAFSQVEADGTFCIFVAAKATFELWFTVADTVSSPLRFGPFLARSCDEVTHLGTLRASYSTKPGEWRKPVAPAGAFIMLPRVEIGGTTHERCSCNAQAFLEGTETSTDELSKELSKGELSKELSRQELLGTELFQAVMVEVVQDLLDYVTYAGGVGRRRADAVIGLGSGTVKPGAHDCALVAKDRTDHAPQMTVIPYASACLMQDLVFDEVLDKQFDDKVYGLQMLELSYRGERLMNELAQKFHQVNRLVEHDPLWRSKHLPSLLQKMCEGLRHVQLLISKELQEVWKIAFPPIFYPSDTDILPDALPGGWLDLEDLFLTVHLLLRYLSEMMNLAGDLVREVPGARTMSRRQIRRGSMAIPRVGSTADAYATYYHCRLTEVTSRHLSQSFPRLTSAQASLRRGGKEELPAPITRRLSEEKTQEFSKKKFLHSFSTVQENSVNHWQGNDDSGNMLASKLKGRLINKLGKARAALGHHLPDIHKNPFEIEESTSSDAFTAERMVNVLKDSRFFRDLDAAVLETLPQHAKFLNVPNGGVLFRQGDPAKGCYIIVSGKVGFYAGSTSGTPRQPATEPNEQIPEAARRMKTFEGFSTFSKVSDYGQCATARCLDESELLFVSGEGFEEVKRYVKELEQQKREFLVSCLPGMKEAKKAGGTADKAPWLGISVVEKEPGSDGTSEGESPLRKALAILNEVLMDQVQDLLSDLHRATYRAFIRVVAAYGRWKKTCKSAREKRQAEEHAKKLAERKMRSSRNSVMAKEVGQSAASTQGREGHDNAEPTEPVSKYLEETRMCVAQIYDDMPAALDVPKIDVMELYAGHADLTFLAHQYGLQAMEPFDLLYGKDMTLRKDKQAWKSAQRTYKPLLAVFETECTDWNIFNENLNYKGKDRMDELYYKRELQYPWSKRASPHAISRSRTTATPGHTAAATAMVIPSEKSINGSPTPPRSPSPSPRR
eukprot:g13734.t2